MSRPTIVRFVEAFVTVFVVGFVAELTSAGRVDLASPEGQSTLVTALGAALLLALRRALASPPAP